MKMMQCKLINFSLLLMVGCALSSCGSKEKKPQKDDNNSYQITIAGKEYSNSWKSDENHENATINSTYMITDDGEKELSLNLYDGENEVDVGVGFSLKNDQPIPLQNRPDGTSAGEDFSFVHIEKGKISYKSFTGTAILSNLKMKGIEYGIGGPANYDLEIEGVFRKFDPSESYLEPEDREQIKITATFHIRSNL